MKKHTIDATNRTLGRIASEAAKYLIGKESVDFARNKVADVTVHIEHASKARISARKGLQTTFVHYTGFPGGLKSLTLDQMIAKKTVSAALKIMVRGMLPKNKLRDLTMKHLTIAE